jgi:hypothetical protein
VSTDKVFTGQQNVLTELELKNTIALMEAGAKTISQDKNLTESAAIQSTAVALIKKLIELNTPVPPEPKAEES